MFLFIKHSWVSQTVFILNLYPLSHRPDLCRRYRQNRYHLGLWRYGSGMNVTRLYHVDLYHVATSRGTPRSTPREQSSWGQHSAHLGPVGPRWAPCWPHEPCYLYSSVDKITCARMPPRLPRTYPILFSAIITWCQFSPKSSEQTPHSSPVRARYGVLVVSLKFGLCSVVIIVMLCVI